jgi:multicomponent Na+:H+ antiporter subunit G
MTDTVSGILLLIGGAFSLIGAVGIVRLPDLFTRMQASTKAVSLGVGCTLLAAAVLSEEAGVATHCLLAIVFLFLTAPIAAHVIARAAYYVGVPLWEGSVVDELHQHRGEESPRPGQSSAGQSNEQRDFGSDHV